MANRTRFLDPSWFRCASISHQEISITTSLLPHEDSLQTLILLVLSNRSIMGEPRSTTPKLRDERRQPAFSYPGLDSSKHEIRLIRLQPRAPSDEIKCELLLANLDGKPNFEALSYEWGSSKSTLLPIHINGQAIVIRENLWWALYYLRFEDVPRILWIDALCINQANTKERNDQVAQMGKSTRGLQEPSLGLDEKSRMSLNLKRAMWLMRSSASESCRTEIYFRVFPMSHQLR